MIIKALIPKEILNIIKKFNINFKPIDEEILLKEIYITFSDALVEMTNVEMIEEVNFWLSSFLETGEIVKVVDEDKKKLLVSSLFLPQVIENPTITKDRETNINYSLMCVNTNSIVEGEKEKIKLPRFSFRKMYNLFTRTKLYFNYDENSFNPKDFGILLPFFGHCKNDFQPSFILDQLWDFFKVVNRQSKTYNDFSKNEELFIDKVNFYLKQKETFNQLITINKENYKLYITNIFKDEHINSKLSLYELFTVEDLVNCNFDNFIEVFDQKEKLLEIINMVALLKEDIKLLINKLTIEKLHLSERDIDIIKKRYQKKSLDLIGKKYGLSRERIRQIERKIILKSEKIKEKMDYNLLLFYSKRGFFISTATIKEIYGENYDIYLYTTPYNYYPQYNILSMNQLTDEYLNFIKGWYDNDDTEYYNITELTRIALDLNAHKEEYGLIDIDLTILYMKSMFFELEQYYFRNKPPLNLLYEIILKEHFLEENGVSMRNIDSFRNKYFEVYKDDSIFKRNDKAILSRIMDNKRVILIGRGTYAYRNHNYDLLSEETINEIHHFIKQEKAVLIEALYFLYRPKIKHVFKNKYELHSFMKCKFEDLYYTKDVVGTYTNPKVNVDEIIYKYAKNNGGIVNLSTFFDDIPILKGIHVGQHFSNSDDYIGIFFSELIHVEFLYYNSEEMKEIKNIIDENLNNKIPVRSNTIYSYFKKLGSDMIRKNKIKSNLFAYNIFRNFYKDDFVYNYPFIQKNEDDRKMNIFKYFVENFKDAQAFKIEDIYSFGRGFNFEVGNMKVLLEVFYEKGHMRLDDLVIAKTDTVIKSRNQNYLVEIEREVLKRLNLVKEIDLDDIDFNWLPSSKIKWNKHLLAHIIMNISNKIEVETIGTQYNQLKYKLRKKVD